jgi:hypothetical protein
MQYLDKEKGMARQGDVLIWSLPEGYVPSKSTPIKAKDGRIVLLEGEATGHHHSIGLKLPQPTMFRDESFGACDTKLGACDTKLGACDTKVVMATLYEDAALLSQLRTDGYLTTERLCVGFLVVEHAPVNVEHQEHDTIQVPPGAYYVGRQQEFIAGEMNYVQD